MDANKNVYKKSMGKTLTDEAGLAVKEVLGAHAGKHLGATFCQGMISINAIWVTPDLVVTGSCRMQVEYGVDNHCLIVVDYVTLSMVVTMPERIV